MIQQLEDKSDCVLQHRKSVSALELTQKVRTIFKAGRNCKAGLLWLKEKNTA